MASKKDELLKRVQQTAKATTAADTFMTERGTDERELKRTISFMVTPSLYQEIQALARFRAAQGLKNSQGQPLSAGSLICQAIEEFLDRNREELEQWKAVCAEMEIKSHSERKK